MNGNLAYPRTRWKVETAVSRLRFSGSDHWTPSSVQKYACMHAKTPWYQTALGSEHVKVQDDSLAFMPSYWKYPIQLAPLFFNCSEKPANADFLRRNWKSYLISPLECDVEAMWGKVGVTSFQLIEFRLQFPSPLLDDDSVQSEPSGSGWTSSRPPVTNVLEDPSEELWMMERKVGHNLTEVMVVHCNMVDSGEDDSSLGRGNVIDMVKMSVTVSLAAKR